jgi:hypothetical protein
MLDKRRSLEPSDSTFVTEKLTKENQHQDQKQTQSAAKFPARSLNLKKVHRLNIRVKESEPAAFRYLGESSPVLSPWVQGLSQRPSLELIQLEAAQPPLSRDLTPVLEAGPSREQKTRDNPKATTQVAGRPEGAQPPSLTDRTQRRTIAIFD